MSVVHKLSETSPARLLWPGVCAFHGVKYESKEQRYAREVRERNQSMQVKKGIYAGE
jgi:hypothetical protein